MEPTDVAEVDVPKRAREETGSLRNDPMGVRLSAELRADVAAICKRDGIPVARFIREAVEERASGREPELARRALLRSATVIAPQFERALELGVLADTDAAEQADEIRRFFAQFVELLEAGPEHESDAPAESEEV